MKIKKFFTLILALLLSLSFGITSFAAELPNEKNTNKYEIAVNDELIILEEGEVAEFPMVLIENDLGIKPYASSDTQVGDAGVLKIWGSGNYLYWNILLIVPATGFSGYVTSTNLTTGQSSGRTLVGGFSGSCYCAKISGHTYSGHLDGTAYLGTVAVAKTNFNTITWVP